MARTIWRVGANSLIKPSSDPLTDSLAERWTTLTGKLPARGRLLAVSKGHPAASIRAVASLGQEAFGESRLQGADALVARGGRTTWRTHHVLLPPERPDKASQKWDG